MRSQCNPDVETLRRLCHMVNRECFVFTERRDTCIFTSAVLLDVLTGLGIEAELMRVEAVSFGSPHATSLGSDGDGTRRPAAGPGMWRGHLAVVAMRRYLMDPTLDQINGRDPLVGEITPRWLSGEHSMWWIDGEPAETLSLSQADHAVRYRAFPGRGGWKGAQAFRPTYRRALVASILAQWEG
jgi:hypothetical protein